MAAHIVTALKQIKEDIKEDRIEADVLFAQINAALNISCWTEELELDEYRLLREIAGGKDVYLLESFVDLHIKKYERIWKSLQEPRNREDWLRAKYPNPAI